MDQRFSQIEEMLKELLEWKKTTENNGLRSSPRPPPTNTAVEPGSSSDHPGRFGGDVQSDADRGLRAPDPVDLSLDGMTVVTDSLQQPGSTFLGERLPLSCGHDLH
jgi:hypothetical protein